VSDANDKMSERSSDRDRRDERCNRQSERCNRRDERARSTGWVGVVDRKSARDPYGGHRALAIAAGTVLPSWPLLSSAASASKAACDSRALLSAGERNDLPRRRPARRRPRKLAPAAPTQPARRPGARPAEAHAEAPHVVATARTRKPGQSRPTRLHRVATLPPSGCGWAARLACAQAAQLAGKTRLVWVGAMQTCHAAYAVAPQ
jgi:hypothetical protein